MAGKIKIADLGMIGTPDLSNWLRGDGSWVSLLNKEEISNKQNSLVFDGTGTKYATVDAVNQGLLAVGGNQNLESVLTNGNSAIDKNIILDASGTNPFKSKTVIGIGVAAFTGSIDWFGEIQRASFDPTTYGFNVVRDSFQNTFLLHPDLNANNYFYAPKKSGGVYTLATLSDIPAAQGTNNYLPKYLNGGYVDSSILENISNISVVKPVIINSGILENSGLTFTQLKNLQTTAYSISDFIILEPGPATIQSELRAFKIDKTTGITYVLTRGGKVYKVNTNGTSSVLGSTPFNDDHFDLVIDANSNIFISHYVSGTIYKMTQSGVVTVFAIPGKFVSFLEFDKQGNLFAQVPSLSFDTDKIVKISPAGVVATYLNFSVNGYTSDDKAPFKLDNLDNLYVQNLYPPGGADKWTPDKVRSNIPFPNTAWWTRPLCDKDNNLYFASVNSTRTLSKISASGVFSTLATFPVGNQPYYTALTPQEDIIATSRKPETGAPNLIHKISKTTGAITEILSSTEELRHIEVDALNNIFGVFLPLNKLVKISPPITFTNLLTLNEEGLITKSNKINLGVNTITLPFSTIVGIDLEERSVITKEWFDNKTIPFVKKSLQDVITVNKTADKIQLLKTFYNPGIFLPTNNFIADIYQATGGGFYAYGNFISYAGIQAQYVIKIKNDGLIDSSFKPPTAMNGNAFSSNSILEDPVTKKLLIGGDFTSINGVGKNRISRFNLDGSVDLAFNTFGGANGSVQGMSFTPDNLQIYVCGFFTTFGGSAGSNLIRISADGLRDLTFATGVWGNGSAVTDALAAADGSGVYVTTYAPTFNGFSSPLIVKILSNGSRDTTFNVGTGISVTGTGTNYHRLLYALDGKLYVYGRTMTFYNGTPAGRIVKLNLDGSIDTSFVTGTGFNLEIFTIVLTTNGKLLITGNFTSYNSQTSYNGVTINKSIVLNTDGSVFIVPPSFVSRTVGQEYLSLNQLSSGKYLGYVSGQITLLNEFFISQNNKQLTFNETTGAAEYNLDNYIETTQYELLNKKTTSFLIEDKLKELNPVLEAPSDNKQYARKNLGWAEVVVPDITVKENLFNKQDSLVTDGSGSKYPTVDAVNAGIFASLGTSGTSGTSGTAGTTGTSGSSGTTFGSSGTSGTSGISFNFARNYSINTLKL